MAEISSRNSDQKIIDEFIQVERDFNECGIGIDGENYFKMSEEELEYCGGKEDGFSIAASYRLALGVHLINNKITKQDAYVKIRKKENVEIEAFKLDGDKKATDEFISLLFLQDTSNKEQPVHPLIHLKSILPIATDMQMITLYHQAKYFRAVKRKELCACKTCLDLKTNTYFLTLCTERMIESGELKIEKFPVPTGEEIWEILAPKEKRIYDYTLNCGDYKNFFLQQLELKHSKMTPYSDSVGLKKMLFQYIESCCRAFKGCITETVDGVVKVVEKVKSGPRFHTPYVTIVQSSGVGKTRSVLELRDDVILVYVCLRDKMKYGEPERSIHAKYFDARLTHKDFLLYYLRFFQLYEKWINTLEGKWPVKKDDFLQKSYEYVDNYDKFWSALEEQHEFVDYDYPTFFIHFNTIVSAIRSKIATGLNILEDDVPMFLFAYDEASSMLNKFASDNTGSQFYNWRRSIAFFPAGTCFSVLLDTSSKVSNFAPSSTRDESLRIRSQGCLLFSPCYWISFRGEFLNRFLKFNEKDEKLLGYAVNIPGSGSTSIKIRPFYNILISRVMFANILLKAEDSDDWVNTMEFIHNLARDKLMGGTDSVLAVEDGGSFRTAISACVLDSIPLDTNLSETLVATHMATLYFVSANRTFLRCKYVAEPVIGAAAASFLTSEVDYTYVVDEIRHRLARGELGHLNNTGNVAEIITCISLLHSNLVCYNSRKLIVDAQIKAETRRTAFSNDAYIALGAPVPLIDFLIELAPSLRNTEWPSSYCKAFVCYNRWIRLRDEDIAHETEYISKTSLLNAFLNLCAIILPPQFPAIDLVIPVAFTDTDKDSFEATEADMTYIGIQVKGWKYPWYQSVRNECLTDMKYIQDTTNLKGPRVLILVQVGSGGMGIGPEEFVKWDSKSELLFIQAPTIRDLCRHETLGKKLNDLMEFKQSVNYLKEYFLHHDIDESLEENVAYAIDDMLRLMPKRIIEVTNDDADAGSSTKPSAANQAGSDEVIFDGQNCDLKRKKLT